MCVLISHKICLYWNVLLYPALIVVVKALHNISTPAQFQMELALLGFVQFLQSLKIKRQVASKQKGWTVLARNVVTIVKHILPKRNASLDLTWLESKM